MQKSPLQALTEKKQEQEEDELNKITQEEDLRSKQQKQFIQNTIRLIKEQQDLTKITIKDQTDLLAKRIGIPKNSTKDHHILTSALLELKRLRRLALKYKIEKPLKIKNPLKEKELKKISTIKRLKNLLKPKTSNTSGSSCSPENR